MSECSWAGGSGRVEQKMVPSLPLLPSVLSVSVKENPNRKKNQEYGEELTNRISDLVLIILALSGI